MKKAVLLISFFLVFVSMSAVEAGERWRLDFQPVKMDRILVRNGVNWVPHWYLIYKVKNPTEETVPLYLSIKAFDDVSKKSYTEMFMPEAVKAIELREKKPLKDVQKMRREIDPGETFTAVAVFRNVHEGTDLMRIEVLGLWDRVTHEGNRVFVEDRVLKLYFSRPGDEFYPQYDKFRFIKKEWAIVTRRERKYR